jgi:hypothetical protein
MLKMATEQHPDIRIKGVDPKRVAIRGVVVNGPAPTIEFRDNGRGPIRLRDVKLGIGSSILLDGEVLVEVVDVSTPPARRSMLVDRSLRAQFTNVTVTPDAAMAPQGDDEWRFEPKADMTIHVPDGFDLLVNDIRHTERNMRIRTGDVFRLVASSSPAPPEPSSCPSASRPQRRA